MKSMKWNQTATGIFTRSSNGFGPRYQICHRKACQRYQSTQAGIVDSGIAQVSNRTLIHISGKDAQKYLQGLTTNNIDNAQRHGQYTAFLNATGRVLMDAFLWPIRSKNDDEWACLLDVEDSQNTKKLESYLKKHKLRSKVVIKRLDQFQIWTAWLQQEKLGEFRYKMPVLDGSSLTSFGHLPDPRVPGLSHRFILPVNTSPSDPSLGLSGLFTSLEHVTDQQYTLRRYINGVPEGSHEIYHEHHQAHPANLDILNAVDFHKGCYVGQELTIRTEHTGVVRKRILPVQIYSKDSPAPIPLTYDASSDIDATSIPFDSKISAPSSKREAGKFIHGLGNIGLAMCRLETMTDLQISAEGGSFTESSEFFIQDGLKVKAFVPNWLRDRLLNKRRKARAPV